MWSGRCCSWFLAEVTGVRFSPEQFFLSYKLLKSRFRMENLIKCSAASVFFLLLEKFCGQQQAGLKKDGRNSFLFGGEECTSQGCSSCSGCRWKASCL